MKKLLVAAMTASTAVALGPVAAAEPSWTMPNLVGMDLQRALRILCAAWHCS